MTFGVTVQEAVERLRIFGYQPPKPWWDKFISEKELEMLYKENPKLLLDEQKRIFILPTGGSNVMQKEENNG